MTDHSSLFDKCDARLALGSQLLTGAGGAVNGATIDMQAYEEAEFLLNIGTITGSGALDAYLQSGANSNASDMANITNAAMTQIAAAANGNVTVRFSLGRPTNRYVRIVVNQSVNNVQAAAVVILNRKSGLNPGANVGQATQTPVQAIRVVQN